MKRSLILFLCSIVILVSCNDSKDEANDKNGPNLIWTKIVDNDTPRAGETIYLTLKVENTESEKVAEDLVVKDRCPDGTTMTGAFAAIGEYQVGSGVWKISRLKPGEEGTLFYGCEIPQGVSGVTILAEVEAIKPYKDPSSKGDILDLKIFVVPTVANLITTLSAKHPVAIEEQNITFTIKIENFGPNFAANTETDFFCPEGTTYTSDNPHEGTVYDDQTGKWSVGYMDFADIKTLEVVCKLDNGTTEVEASSVAASSSSVDLVTGTDSLTTQVSVTTQCASDFSTITDYSELGDGLTDATAFEIGNPEQLNDLAINGEADWDKSFILCENLDFSGVEELETLGISVDEPFKGRIVGNNKVISNLESDHGLILYGEGVEIENITIQNSNINCDKDACSFFVDYLAGEEDSEFINLEVLADSSLSNQHRYSGMIIGVSIAQATITLSNITNRATFNLSPYTGSGDVYAYSGTIIGYMTTGGVQAQDVFNYGNITSDGHSTGGMFGHLKFNLSTSFDNIQNHGDIYCSQDSSTRSYIGGVFGFLEALSNSGVISITNSRNEGSFSSAGASVHHLGGFIGYLKGLDDSNYFSISNSYVADGVIIANNQGGAADNTGGFVGMMTGVSVSDTSTISDSYSRAVVNGEQYVGGFVGSIYRSHTIDNCQAYNNVTGSSSYVAGFAGRINESARVLNSTAYAASIIGQSAVAGFVGQFSYSGSGSGNAEINNSHVDSATVRSEGGRVAGFVDYAYDNGTIIDSSTTLVALISEGSSNSYIGGFASHLNSTDYEDAGVTITNSHVYASGITLETDTNASQVGGFIGRAIDGGHQITNCSTNLNVNGASHVGGFIGYTLANIDDAENTINISNSSATGNVECSNLYCGGFVGTLGAYSIISDSSSTGDVINNIGGYDHGGFFGRITGTGKITTSYSTGDINSNGTEVGGFGGSIEGEGDVTDSYVDNESIKGRNSIAGFIADVHCFDFSIPDDEKCDIKRNYVKTTSIEDYNDGLADEYVSAGFIRYVHTKNNGTQINIEDNFTQFTTLKSKSYVGGFIESLSVNGTASNSTDEVNVKRNFVSSGTIERHTEGNASHWGGFIARTLNYTTNFQGTINIEDNYTNVILDTSNFNTATPANGLGGFVGYHYGYANINYQNNYTNVSTVDGDDGIRYVGGFVGYISSAASGYNDPSFINNISASSNITGSTHESDYFIGYNTAVPVLTNNYYNSNGTCTGVGACDGTQGGTGVTLASLQGNSTNAPYDQWDFASVWEIRAGQLPGLQCSSEGSTEFCTEWANAQ